MILRQKNKWIIPTTLPKTTYPSGPQSLLPFGSGHLLKLASNPLTFLRKLTAYGDIAFFRIGPLKFFFLNEPSYIKEMLVTQQRHFNRGNSISWLKHLLGEGLITSEGDFHLSQRRLVQPAFHKKRIENYAEIMTETANQIQVQWHNGLQLEIGAAMQRLTMAVVTKALFSIDLTATDSTSQQLGAALKAIGAWSERSRFPPVVAEFLDTLPLPKTRRFIQARQFLDKLIYQLIAERRTAPNTQNTDLISILMEMETQEAPDNQRRLTDKQIRDEILTLFMAGHGTVSLALTWAWYLLAQHPEVETKLHAELDQVLGGRTPTMEDLPNLRYTEQVFTEVLRMYPPAYILVRNSTKACEIAGYSIPALSFVVASPFVAHHNQKYFNNPDQFEPARWTPTFKSSLPKFAFFPFGGGPRVCIGEPFAWMEGVLVLASLAQHWKLQLDTHHQVKVKPLLTLRTKNGVSMILKRRHPVSHKSL
jgi:cytochrome P450